MAPAAISSPTTQVNPAPAGDTEQPPVGVPPQQVNDQGGYKPMDMSEAGASTGQDEHDHEMGHDNNAGIETHETTPTMEYMAGLMQEFQRLEGKLSTLLDEHSRVHQENDDLRNRPEPDLNAVADLEALTVKYNKVKKLYFQREQQVEELTADVASLQAEREELVRDLNTLTKDRDNAVGELEDITRERDSLTRERNTMVRERDAVVRERDAVLRERDTINRLKDEALQEQVELSNSHEDVKLERSKLQLKVQELEGEVKSLQAQAQASALANGLEKRRSAPASTGTSAAGGGHTDEILKLKYDKVKRLYYDQMKTIDALHEQIRNMEASKALDPTPPSNTTSNRDSKGKMREYHTVSPERSAKGETVDITPQRRTSVRSNSSKRNSAAERVNRLSIGPDAPVL